MRKVKCCGGHPLNYSLKSCIGFKFHLLLRSQTSNFNTLLRRLLKWNFQPEDTVNILITMMFFKLLIVTKEALNIVMENHSKLRKYCHFYSVSKLIWIIKLNLCIIQVFPNITWSFLAICKKRGCSLIGKLTSFFFPLYIFAVYVNVLYWNRGKTYFYYKQVSHVHQPPRLMAKYKSIKFLFVLGLISH